jgi:putative photosynthetic complex assembly protein
MSHDHHQNDPPKPLLIGAALLMIGSLLIAYFGKGSQFSAELMPETRIVAAYDVRLLKNDDGTIAAFTSSGTPLEVLSIEKAGFVSGVLRGFARGRSLTDTPADVPYRLIRYTDGRFVLEDTGTGERVALDVFGPTNAETFARLWRASDRARLAGS